MTNDVEQKHKTAVHKLICRSVTYIAHIVHIHITEYGSSGNYMAWLAFVGYFFVLTRATP